MVRAPPSRHLFSDEADNQVPVGEVPQGGGRLARESRFGADRSGKLYRARSRLYLSQILQLNMRLKALAEIYNTLLCTAPKSHVFLNLLKFCQKIANSFF